MQDEVRLNRILSQLEEIKREVKSMLPPPTPAPKPMPAPKAEPSITTVQKPALPASVCSGYQAGSVVCYKGYHFQGL